MSVAMGKSRRAALVRAAEQGVAQIGQKSYDGEAPAERVRYGMAFCGKDVAVVGRVVR